MKTTRYFLCSLLFCLAYWGCEKPDDRPCSGEPHVTKVPAFFYDYIFRDSSTWIYNSSIDSTLDTVLQEVVTSVG